MWIGVILWAETVCRDSAKARSQPLLREVREIADYRFLGTILGATVVGLGTMKSTLSGLAKVIAA
jgi:hypothetical protein